jgi:FkbM family methyltransferase
LLPSLSPLLPAGLRVEVVDVGANPIDEVPPYKPLLAVGRARVTGFEPNRTALARLQGAASAAERYLPHAVGDGARVTFRLCRAPGMSSTLPLNEPLMRHFHGFTEWGQVVSEEAVDTVRLDDLVEVPTIDYLKIDVQGGELAVFEGARSRLARALCVHTEVMFQDMYVGQPLFADQDALLRGLGFRLHCFTSPMARCLKPVLIDNDPYRGLNQLLQADAVYVRDFARLELLPPDDLLKLALIAHDLYHSFDLANLALLTLDRRQGGQRSPQYLAGLATR